MAINSDKGKEKGTQNNEKQSADLSSSNTSASTPEKKILSSVNKTNQQVDIADRVTANKAETNTSKNQLPFSLEQEISKIKISVPLTELATQNVYRTQILKALKIEENNETVNLNDDHPELIFGPKIEDKYQEGPIPAFYVSLNIHEKKIHERLNSHKMEEQVPLDTYLQSLDQK